MFIPVVEHLKAAGHDPDQVLASVGFSRQRLEAPGAMLSVAELGTLLLTVRKLTGRTDLPFELGRNINPLDAFGALVFAAMGCSTVEDMFEFFCRRFSHMSDLFTADYARDGDCAVVRIRPCTPIGLELEHFMLEFVAACVPVMIRRVAGTPADLVANVFISMPRPPHFWRYARSPYDRFAFESQLPGITVVMPQPLLEWRLPMAAPRSVAHFEAALARRDAPGSEAGLAELVRAALREAHGKPPTIEELAQSLGVSARTLDRNLSREGCSFRELAREVLIDRARALLAVPGASITQVAQRLGFSDAANFTRSFRRATGVTPGDQRADAGAGFQPRSLTVD